MEWDHTCILREEGEEKERVSEERRTKKQSDRGRKEGEGREG